MDLFNKVHIFELMKSRIYEPNISLISLFSLMLNYAKPQIAQLFVLKREPTCVLYQSTNWALCTYLNYVLDTFGNLMLCARKN